MVVPAVSSVLECNSVVTSHLDHTVADIKAHTQFHSGGDAYVADRDSSDQRSPSSNAHCVFY